MVDIVISVAAKVAEYLVDPVKIQLSYICNSHHHVKDVLQKIDDLGHAREKVEELVKEASRQGDKIYPHVQEWLQATETILQTRANLVQDEEHASKGCFHLKSRHHLSKKAMKQGEDVDAKLNQGRDFGNTVSHPPSPPPLVSPGSSTNDAAFPSRLSIFNQIMEALRNEQTSIVGVWGMGGVGKTTLALQVAERAEEEKLFDKVVMASSISQTPIISDIQIELAKTLGLTFEEGRNRSVGLMNSLKNQERILVILDDIWNKLDLRKIGIPYGDDHKGCKLLLTSREYDVVVTDMMAQKVFHLPHLKAEEAWSLFKRTAGDSVEYSPELKATADKIVRKCEGLPVAIVTVASALKNKSMGEWKNALKELKMAKPMNVRGMSDNVYSCLQLSYNHLEGDEVKSLFLLCGLLGGRLISKDRLLLYATGLNMFEGLYSLEEATNKLIALVGKLIASSLLLDAEEGDNDRHRSLFFDDSFVKMHDVVRDVARSIASKDAQRQYVVSEAVELREWERRGECRNHSGISLECRDTDELPPRLVCPELELFLLNSSRNQPPPRRPELRIPEDFFQGVTKLGVLHVSAVSLRPSPPSLGFLSNLRTLCLIGCQIGDMTIIGEMKGLQALSLAESTFVELPKEIGQLKDLRVLDLQGCISLRKIPRNVISSLSGLVGLSLRRCYKIQWGRDGESNNNKACLSEVKDLPRLRTLEVHVSDPSLLPAEDIGLDLINLTRYSIIIHDRTTFSRIHSLLFDGFEMKWLYKLDLIVPRRLVAIGVESPVMRLKCFSNLFKTCQFVLLENLSGISNVVYDLANENGFPQLKHLRIFSCCTIRHIFSSSLKWVPPRDTFCGLDRLDLSKLLDLESVFDFHESAPILIECFGKLRFLRLRDCHKLRCVMSLPMQNGRELSFFPRLQELELNDLSHINSFYSTATTQHSYESMSILFNKQEGFPDLEILSIKNLKGVVEIWQGQFSRVSFSKLRVLKIWKCQGISFVISRNMIHMFHNLEKLEVKYCGSVNEVIQLLDEEPTIDDIDFSQLKSLNLTRLPNLKGFSSATCTFRFPSLEEVEIAYCPKREFFCKGLLVHTPSLKLEGINNTSEESIYIRKKSDTCKS